MTGDTPRRGQRPGHPIPPPLQQFVAELRQLQRGCGGPSIRQLAALTRQAGKPFARSTINDKLSGVSRPSWEFVQAFVQACARYGGSRTPVDLDCWRESHQRLLRELAERSDPPNRMFAAAGDDAGDGAGDGAVGRPSDLPTPRQLPSDVAGFTGRARALAMLDDILAASEREASSVAVVAVSGPAGIGKTAVAVHWAHRVAARFDDGQLYVNLRGFEPSATPMPAAQAVRGFLDAFGVPPERIPRDPTAQAALYRSLLAGKRVLVVLDNARDAEQVRLLLPGTAGCLVVVTSRDQLLDLAAEGASPLMLDLFTAEESRDLLVGRLGVARVEAVPRAVDEIIAQCARLPLALAIVTAHAAIHPRFGLDALAAKLRGSAGSLDAFAVRGGDRGVRAAFSWSYRTLGDEAARLFRLLGVHAGPDIGLFAAASLAGHPVGGVRGALVELTHAHLVAEHAPGRYCLHDLLKVYATELTDDRDPPSVREAARRRLFDHYLRTATAAAQLLNPRRAQVPPPPPQPGVEPEDVADQQAALRWFAAEQPVLLAAIPNALVHDHHGYTWRLASTLQDVLTWRWELHALAAAHRAALAAARRSTDLLGEAHARHGLARACAMLERYEEAEAHLRRIVEIFEESGDRVGQARTYLSLGNVYERRGEYDTALGYATCGRDLLHDNAISGIVMAQALGNVGGLQARLGNYRDALANCWQSLERLREIGDRHGQAVVLNGLGHAHHRLGEHRHAVACYRRAADLFREFGDRESEGFALDDLGDSHLAAGQPDAARRAWLRALARLRHVGHPRADQVRAKLAHARAAATR